MSYFTINRICAALYVTFQLYVPHYMLLYNNTCRTEYITLQLHVPQCTQVEEVMERKNRRTTQTSRVPDCQPPKSIKIASNQS